MPLKKDVEIDLDRIADRARERYQIDADSQPLSRPTGTRRQSSAQMRC